MAFWINIYGCQPHPRHGPLSVKQPKNDSYHKGLYTHQLTKVYFCFFSIFKNGLGTLLCVIFITIFVLRSHMKLHVITDPESTKSLAKYYIHIILFLSLTLVLMTLLIIIKGYHVYTSHVKHLVSFLYFWIFLSKYYINQNPSLKLYVSCYHHQPPPVLPWQLPKNYNTDSVKVYVISQE